MKLIYINSLSSNYKGEFIYEFIFTDNINEVWGEGWDHNPCQSYPDPPSVKYVSSVEILQTSDIELELIQNSDYFCMSDAVDGVISLGWELVDEVPVNKERLHFNFGEDVDSVKDKLYARDILLKQSL